MLIVLVSGLSAQKIEISPFYGYFRPIATGLGSLQSVARDSDTKLTPGTGAGARVTWNTKGYYGVELGYSQSKLGFETAIRPSGATADVIRTDKVKVQQGFLNFLAYFMPAGERFRPFITGGVQLQQYGRPVIDDFDIPGTRNYGANYGGGLKIKLFKHALIRIDLRDYIGGKPYDLTREDERNTGGRQRQLEGSVGLAITF